MRTLLLLIVALFPLSAQAQTYLADQGSVLLGGTASLSSSSSSIEVNGRTFDDDDRTTTLTLQPTAQFFVIPGLAVGGTVSAMYASFDDDSFSALGVGPAVSYYAGGPDRAVYPFVSANVLPVFTNSDDDGDTVLTYGLSTGIAVPLARNVALSGAAFYRGSRTEDGNVEATTGTYGLEFGIAAFVF